MSRPCGSDLGLDWIIQETYAAWAREPLNLLDALQLRIVLLRSSQRRIPRSLIFMGL